MRTVDRKVSLAKLLNPRSIAVVGASPKGGRGGRTLANLRETKFHGDVYAVNPRYDEVLGYPCYRSLEALPAVVDCALMAVGADTTCDVLEKAFEIGTSAAVVLAAGFGEGGQNEERAERIRALGARGMSVCGPNCYGLLSITEHGAAASFSGRLPSPLRAGRIALVSQSGGLTNNAFSPLMTDRRLGFRYIVSCGNQLATSVEDYLAYFAEDDGVSMIAAIVESIAEPRKLFAAARIAHERAKRMIFFHVGRSRAGREMARSHTGALIADADVVAAFLRYCGIVCADDYDRFVEAIELFAVAPAACKASREAIVISGSGGAAAIIADEAESSGLSLPPFDLPTQEKIRAALPDFGRVTNPVDGTGSMSDDPTVLRDVLRVVAQTGGNATIAAVVSAKAASAKEHRFSEIIAETARSTERLVAAFQYSPLGGPLDPAIVDRLHSAGAPLLLGTAMAMRVLPYLPRAQELRRKALSREHVAPLQSASLSALANAGFIQMRAALVEAGVNIIATELACSEEEAVLIQRRFACPVALKAEAQGLTHKTDAGCVRLGCESDEAVRIAFRTVVDHARGAGYDQIDGVLVQPMASGVAEVYAGAIFDPTFGPAICFGLGGIFVELLDEVVVETAPLTRSDALDMIRGVRGASILFGARGRPEADVEALADLLVGLGRFAINNVGFWKAIDLNPIIVKPAGQGVTAVDIAIDAGVMRPAL